MAGARLDGAVSDQRRLAAVCCLIGFGFSAGMALRSNGGYEDYDDLRHFQNAAGVWTDARFLAHEWARPGFTAPYALAALGGWRGARLLSSALAALTAYLAFLSAQRLGVRTAWLAAPLTLAQPLFFSLSYTTLTETPAAFYIALSLWVMLQGRFVVSSAVLSIALVTRWELIAFAPLWLIAVAVYAQTDSLRNRVRRAAALLVLVVPAIFWAPIAHNVAAIAIGWEAPVRVYLGSEHATYPSGDVAAFLAHLTTTAGLAIAVLGIAGCSGLLDRPRGWLIGAMVFVFLAVQTVLHVRAAFASGGYARFVVTIAPLMAIAAARGWQMLADTARGTGRPADQRALLAAFVLVYGGYELHRILGGVWWDLAVVWAYRAVAVGVIVLALANLRSGRPRGVSALAGVACFLIAAQLVIVAEPHRRWPRQDEIAATVDYARHHHLAGRAIDDASPWADAFTRRALTADDDSYFEHVASAATGELAIWDEFYAKDANVHMSLSRMLAGGRWSLEYVAPPRPGHWPSVMLFERQPAP